MTTLLSTLKTHRALIAWVPAALLALWASLWLYAAATGRAPADPGAQPDGLIALAYRGLLIVMALAFASMVKHHEALNRPITGDGWQMAVVSRAQTVLLIAVFCYVLSH